MLPAPGLPAPPPLASDGPPDGALWRAGFGCGLAPDEAGGFGCALGVVLAAGEAGVFPAPAIDGGNVGFDVDGGGGGGAFPLPLPLAAGVVVSVAVGGTGAGVVGFVPDEGGDPDFGGSVAGLEAEGDGGTEVLRLDG